MPQAIEKSEELVELTENIERVSHVDAPTLDENPQVDELSYLKSKRIGLFPIEMSKDDATYLRNLLNGAEFTGPRQAYLLVMAKAEMDSILNELKSKDLTKRHTVELASAVIESLNFFMSNKTGKGGDSANKLFYASMIIRPSVMELTEIDKRIQELMNSSVDAK